jgi:arabinofuranan 3-O-arabinosyltransferase
VFHDIGVAELSVPRVAVQRTVVMPRDLRAGTAVRDVKMTTPVDARTSCVLVGARPLCTVGTARPGEEDAGIDRTFALPAPGRYALSLTAIPHAGVALDRLIATAVRPDLAASASSQAIDDPLAGPQTAVDGDLGTGWIATSSDPNPTLTLRWHGMRRITGLNIFTDPFLAATAPDVVTVRAGHVSRVAAIGANGVATFRALHADRLSLTLTSSTGLKFDYDPFGHALTRLGIGVSEVVVPGVTTTGRASTDALPVALPCGAGPAVLLDGAARSTSVATTVGALRELQPVTLTVCGKPSTSLSAGQHRFRALSTGLWTVTGAQLRGSSWPPAAAQAVPASVRHWGGDDRTVAVGARAAPTLLVVHENANRGWAATLDGHPLRRITVDGWQQGYVVPAGKAGVVQLTYTPDTWYRLALLTGAIAVVVLVVLAFVRPRRHGRRHARRERSKTRIGRDAAIAAVAVAAMLGLSGLAVVAAIGVLWWLRPASWRAWVAATLPAAGALAVAVLTCGVLGAVVWAGVLSVALAADARSFVAPFLRVAMAVVAAGCYFAAGIVLAVHHWGVPGYAAATSSAQVLSLIAVLAVLLASVRAPWTMQRADGRAPAPATPSPAAPRSGT